MCENSTDIVRHLAIFLHKMIDYKVFFLVISHNWNYTTSKRHDKRIVKSSHLRHAFKKVSQNLLFNLNRTKKQKESLPSLFRDANSRTKKLNILYPVTKSIYHKRAKINHIVKYWW